MDWDALSELQITVRMHVMHSPCPSELTLHHSGSQHVAETFSDGVKDAELRVGTELGQLRDWTIGWFELWAIRSAVRQRKSRVRTSEL